MQLCIEFIHEEKSHFAQLFMNSSNISAMNVNGYQLKQCTIESLLQNNVIAASMRLGQKQMNKKIMRTEGTV